MIEVTQQSFKVLTEGTQTSHRLLMSTGTERFSVTPETFILSQPSLVNFLSVLCQLKVLSECLCMLVSRDLDFYHNNRGANEKRIHKEIQCRLYGSGLYCCHLILHMEQRRQSTKVRGKNLQTEWIFSLLPLLFCPENLYSYLFTYSRM